MNAAGRTQRETPRGARWLAGMLCALVLALGALAAAPDVHLDLHDDAGQADHSCAITLFAGGAEPVQPPVLGSVPTLFVVSDAATAPESVAFPEAAHLRPPVAGPPAG